MLVAERLADFAFDLKYEDLPPNIVEAAQRHLFDSIACALGASNVGPVRALAGLALTNGGRPDATILGTDSKIPVTAAALIGGTMVRYLDANDIFAPGEGGSGHYSDAIPALIALAEMQGASGKELLTCIVAVYELQFAAGRAFSFGRRGFHSISQLSWALPVVATRMLGANREAAVHAMGLAGATGLVLNTWLRPSETIPSIKGVASGLAAERAVESAILAASGITASRDALEYISSRLQGSDEAPSDLNGLDGLGKRYSITRNVIKRYPAQINTQAAIQAVLELHAQGLRAEDVKSLRLYGHRGVSAGVQGSAEAFSPASREAADHSTPFVMAMALRQGKLTLDAYEGEPWLNPEVRSLMSRIELIVDPQRDEALNGAGRLGVRVVAETSSDRHFESEVQQPKGHPDNPLDDVELIAKGGWLLEGIAEPGTAGRLWRLCHELEALANVRPLVEACCVKSAPAL